MVQEPGGGEERNGKEVLGIVNRFDELVKRVGIEVARWNQPLAMRFRVGWIRLRATIWKELEMNMKLAVNDEEGYIAWWENHLDEMYEVGQDMTVVWHGEGEEVVCEELLW